MNEIAWIRDVIYCIPLAALIWKAATLTSDFKHLKQDVELNVKKFCAEHKELEASVNHNKVVVDDLIKDIHDKLTSIQISVAKIEAKTEGKKDED